VVPVEGQAWTSDPFTVRRDGDRLYGRGVADMKGFIACALAAAPAFAAAPLRRPVHIALTFDEEIGCKGAPELIEWAATQSPRPAIAFVGEPTSMRIVDAHKGIMVCRTTIRGKEAHSSLSHLGVSAIDLAGRAIGVLHAVAADAAGVTDARFLPAATSVSVNRIGGGTATNILAGEAWFDWDIRTVPGVEAAAIRDAFTARLEEDVIGPARGVHAEVTASTETLSSAPGLVPEPDGAAERLARRLTGDNAPQAVAYAAEAGQFQRSGLSVVIVGPGSIDQAHTADEWIALDQLAQCDRFMMRLATELSA
jgi:acetylornithine deacetylase